MSFDTGLAVSSLSGPFSKTLSRHRSVSPAARLWAAEQMSCNSGMRRLEPSVGLLASNWGFEKAIQPTFTAEEVKRYCLEVVEQRDLARDSEVMALKQWVESVKVDLQKLTESHSSIRQETLAQVAHGNNGLESVRADLQRLAESHSSIRQETLAQLAAHGNARNADVVALQNRIERMSTEFVGRPQDGGVQMDISWRDDDQGLRALIEKECRALLEKERMDRQAEMANMKQNFEMQNCSIKETVERQSKDAKQEIKARESGCETLRDLCNRLFEACHKRSEELHKHIDGCHASSQNSFEEHRSDIQAYLRELKVPELREQMQMYHSGHNSSITDLREFFDKHRATMQDNHDSHRAELQSYFDTHCSTTQSNCDQIRMYLADEFNTRDSNILRIQEALDGGVQSHTSRFADFQEQMEVHRRNVAAMPLEITNLRLQVAGLKDMLSTTIATSMSQQEAVGMIEQQRVEMVGMVENQRYRVYDEVERLRAEVVSEACKREALVVLVQESLNKEKVLRELALVEMGQRLEGHRASTREDMVLVSGDLTKGHAARDAELVAVKDDILKLFGHMDSHRQELAKVSDAHILSSQQTLDTLRADMSQDTSARGVDITALKELTTSLSSKIDAHGARLGKHVESQQERSREILERLLADMAEEKSARTNALNGVYDHVKMVGDGHKSTINDLRVYLDAHRSEHRAELEKIRLETNPQVRNQEIQALRELVEKEKASRESALGDVRKDFDKHHASVRDTLERVSKETYQEISAKDNSMRDHVNKLNNRSDELHKHVESSVRKMENVKIAPGECRSSSSGAELMKKVENLADNLDQVRKEFAAEASRRESYICDNLDQVRKEFAAEASRRESYIRGLKVLAEDRTLTSSRSYGVLEQIEAQRRTTLEAANFRRELTGLRDPGLQGFRMLRADAAPLRIY